MTRRSGPRIIYSLDVKEKIISFPNDIFSHAKKLPMSGSLIEELTV